MPKFKAYNYNQDTMVVINFKEQLQPGTFEHAIHFLIDNKLDLSLFDKHYKNDDGGRPAYDPAILLKIVLFAYSRGITSSREIQWCCETNIIFKALSCDAVPHFTTIAAFVSSYPEEIEQLFEQILLVCHKQGLLGNDLFAIDGCKMSSNAAKEWSGTFKELEEKKQKIRSRIRHCVQEHRKLDKNGPSDAPQAARQAQTIKTLEQAFDRIDQFLKMQAPRMGQGKRPKEVKSNITDNESAKMTTSKGTIQGYNGVATVDKKHQIIVDAQAYGHGQEHHTLRPVLESLEKRYQRLKIRQNLLNQKTIVTADTGFANEANMKYLHDRKINAYIPDNQFRSRDPRFQGQKDKHGKRHQNKPKQQKRNVIPASEFTFDPVAMTCICPVGKTLRLRGVRDSSTGQPTAYFEGRLLQCRHCPLKTRCMHNPKAADHRKGAGRQVSFQIDGKRKPTYTDWMKHRVDSDRGKAIYGHRLSVVEPVFGNMGFNKRLNRFSLRGKAKVQGQWQLYCMVHNIEKLKNYGRLSS
ncbi:transposase [Parahaliea mediterranea]|uniref:Transposase n=1 Tax=Parahaliea mediterranea TaxID=651086 RepID=A0A939IPL6_9GAMM|nr:transposase [Parahaliea mediterranea]MBN7799187.1 transposase [Parahaliea mediterranea]